jgi:hypothetical protein
LKNFTNFMVSKKVHAFYKQKSSSKVSKSKVNFQFLSKLICLFRLFRYGFEISKQTEPKIFVWFRETNQKSTETDEFCFVSVRTDNFLLCFVDTLVFMVLFSYFFRFVSKHIYLFRLFRLFWNGLKIPKQKFFSFAKQTENQPKQI